MRKTFSVSENHHEQCTIPRAAKQLPDRARRGEGRKEGKRVGEEGSWLVILYYFLMFKKK